MSWDQYSETPASNYISGYFLTGMAPSSVKVAGSDIMADLASRFAAMHTTGGTANAQTLTQTRQLASLVNGLELIVLPGFTNTGAMTFAPDGLAAKNVFANGAAAIAGMWVLNVPAHIKYDGTQWNLLNPQSSTGSYTGTGTGLTTSPTATISYRITSDGKFCTIVVPIGITGTSNAATFTITGGPSVINSNATFSSACMCYVEDNGTANQLGCLFPPNISSSGTIVLGKGIGYNGGGFTGSAVKAFPTGNTASFTYILS